MRIKLSQLRQIIKEEVARSLLKEEISPEQSRADYEKYLKLKENGVRSDILALLETVVYLGKASSLDEAVVLLNEMKAAYDAASSALALGNPAQTYRVIMKYLGDDYRIPLDSKAVTTLDEVFGKSGSVKPDLFVGVSHKGTFDLPTYPSNKPFPAPIYYRDKVEDIFKEFMKGSGNLKVDLSSLKEYVALSQRFTSSTSIGPDDIERRAVFDNATKKPVPGTSSASEYNPPLWRR